MEEKYDVIIIGAGFAGLSAARQLCMAGLRPLVLEASDSVGGLGGDFAFHDGVRLEKFYHHWFNNDTAIQQLIIDLGLEKNILRRPSRVGLYYNRQLWRLSTPLDLLRFRALPFISRMRLGLLVLYVRLIKNWRRLEHLSIEQWLKPIVGQRAYDLVWRPLITAKFSIYARDINAVWMWKKLALRGGSRQKNGDEELLYYRGGFGQLARQLANDVVCRGGVIKLNHQVDRALIKNGQIIAIETSENNKGKPQSNNKTARQQFTADKYIFTPALPLVSTMLRDYHDAAFHQQLRAIRYLGNMCLVLRLKHSLSETYWINVNDPGFPFVGVIEHTNFDPPKHYGGSHMVFLSRYIATSDPLWQYNDQDYADYCFQHLKKMFPQFDKNWVLDYALWREPYAQPIMEKHYSRLIPPVQLPVANGYLCTMAQIYPEDRGTNYAVREGERLGKMLASTWSKPITGATIPVMAKPVRIAPTVSTNQHQQHRDKRMNEKI
ncbi:MAG: NAD(P)/FAD-dependent oxidoreductase [Alphaproteobacteria bacterium]|nr:NAD(P)/FAD-dependent oxidoreductase [Alphaproteobacteria bacterium]